LHLDVVVGFGVPGVQIPDQQVDPPAHVTGQGVPTVGRDHEVRFGDVARNLAGEGVAGCEYEDRVHNDKIVLRAPTRVRPNLQVEVEGRNGLVETGQIDRHGKRTDPACCGVSSSGIHVTAR